MKFTTHAFITAAFVLALFPVAASAQTNHPVSLGTNLSDVCYGNMTTVMPSGDVQMRIPPELSAPATFSPTGFVPAGPCYQRYPTMYFSVSHETLLSEHSGDLNNVLPNGQPNLHLADYVYDQDFGKWVNAGIYGDPASPTLAMALDTLNFYATTPTGRAIQNGHLFFGFNDTNFDTTRNSMGNDIYAEFDITIPGLAQRQSPFMFSDAGQRIMLGVVVDWPEADASRTNRTHFMEFDLYKSPLFSYAVTPDPSHCSDAPYDYCWFDPNGTYSEGRYVGYQSYLQADNSIPFNLNTGNPTHVKLPISQVIRSLNWVSPPASWEDAKIVGTYIGIESMGASWTWMQVQNYKLYSQTQDPSVLGLPFGLVKLANSAGLLSYPTGVCLLPDGNALANWSFSQHDYDIAPLVTIPDGYSVPVCPYLQTPFKNLFRVGNTAYLQQSNYYCAFDSMEAIFQRGYTYQDYAAAPQVFLADKGLIYTGACRY